MDRVLQAALRSDLPSFTARCFRALEPGRAYQHNWHIDHIGYHLERVARGEERRLAVTIPPRHLKSITITIAFSAWALGHDPGLKIIAVSYAKDLARKHALDFRQIVESDWYQELFPAVRFKRRRRDMELTTTENGYRFATSVDGSVLGRGADLIIIDDPIKAQDARSEAERRRVNQFYDNTLFTRLNDKGRGAIVLVMQRLHQDDLVGHVLQKEDWTEVRIPAIETEDRAYRLGPHPNDLYWRRRGEVLHEEREPRAILEQIRRSLGSRNFEAQYQQSPVPDEGNVVKRVWLRSYDQPPRTFDVVVVSWDTASTLEESSDFSVGTVWGLLGNEIYLVHVERGRYEVPDLRRLVTETHRRFGADATLIEDTDIGRAIGQDMRRARGVLPIMLKPRFTKTARMLAQSAKFEAGQVLLPADAPWLATYLQELLGFPAARHDDQVDSTSQALAWLTTRLEQGTPPARPNPQRPPGAAHVRRPPGMRRPLLAQE